MCAARICWRWDFRHTECSGVHVSRSKTPWWHNNADEQIAVIFGFRKLCLLEKKTQWATTGMGRDKSHDGRSQAEHVTLVEISTWKMSTSWYLNGRRMRIGYLRVREDVIQLWVMWSGFTSLFMSNELFWFDFVFQAQWEVNLNLKETWSVWRLVIFKPSGLEFVHLFTK